MSEFAKRMVTGVVLIAVVALVAWIDSFFLTWLFFGIIFLLAFYEAMRLYGMQNYNSLYFWAFFTWIVASFYPNPDDLFFLVALVFAGYEAFTQDKDSKKFLPFLYPMASFLFLLSLYHDFGMEALVWLVIVVALTDVGAYFTGRAIGKHPFCKTSPKKTWEGVFGGVIVATIFGSWYGVQLVELWQSIVISLLASFAGVFGDLFESYLKRRAGVKDSGNILPGHGGILDRVDGYLFAAPTMVILLRGLL
ncbi:phosphatidate cytidylyltransferase [Nitratiruptor sp. SB155-2]|uniref:phosphatidate cytidylyltransferase n=1 Tax=Nitratiruptor sp. (strain SB155-2) TaxID=387092 RepID=UPI00015873CE|nr:phosphatidate cytidylyltransferase [Nitratiruptor sp. SB155-2]BAF70773.1 phosphatidate cytidylyltransferase [Nitratiruptor sp. SB155-2]